MLIITTTQRLLDAIRDIVTAVVAEETQQHQTQMKELITMTAQDTVNQITQQLGKAKDEIVNKIAELEAANPEVDFTALTAAAQALDDVVVDTPDPQPGEPVE